MDTIESWSLILLLLPKIRYNCNSYLELFILTTHSTKRYPGLGTELVRQTLELARRRELAVCVASATSFYSQKIFAKLGFESLKVFTLLMSNTVQLKPIIPKTTLNLTITSLHITLDPDLPNDK